MARVVVIGDLMTDAVARATLPLARGSDTPASVTMHGGGSGANIAAWMAADGGDVAFVGRRGADIAGRNRDMELMGYGVDARLVMDPERPTGTCVVMVTHKGEHTMLSDPGANAALSPDDLPHDLFVPGAHLHVSGYTLLSEGARAAGLAAIDYARRTNMTASVDAASSAPLERVGAEPFLELSSGAVLLFVNAAQAKVLTGRPKGLGLAVVAGLGFAGFFLCINQTGNSSALWSAAFSRCTALLLVAVILAVKRARGPVATRFAGLGLLAGVLDVSGTAFFIRADQTGRLDASVVLCSLYPMITVLLAICFLKERFTRIKLAGIAAAIVAVPLIVLK